MILIVSRHYAMRHSFIALLLSGVCICSGATWSMDPASRLKGNEREAWKAFFAGVECLQEQGDRQRAADFFEQVAKEFPETRYATDSKELAGFLRQMVEEDKQWTAPRDPAALSVEGRIRYHTYHLRDVNCYP